MPDLMRDTLISELKLSARIVREGTPLVPRFRIASGDGNFVLFAPHQKHLNDRRKSERFIKGFMLWTLTHWFVLSSETKDRDGVASILIARDRRLGVMRRLMRDPAKAGGLEWLNESAILPEIANLLPDRRGVIGQRQYQELMSRLRRGGIEVAGPF